MKKNPIIAVAGATGLVGGTLLKIMEERQFPHAHLYPLASARSKGHVIHFGGRDYEVEELSASSFEKDIDLIFMAAGGAASLAYAPLAAAAGAWVVDNSSAWRMDPQVPLVVPEVNPEVLEHLPRGIVANPNCSTIQAMLPIKVLHDAYEVKRIVFSTYQSVSGAGYKGILDLEEGMKGKDLCQAFPHPIAGNCIPHIDDFLDNGYTKEEMKMIDESRKILHLPDLPVTATTVRVPVFCSHSESINLEFKKPVDIEEARQLLAQASGITVEDDPAARLYPLARKAQGSDQVYVGRIRRDFSVASGMNFWCVADNIRKGAATNAVQIAELLLKKEK